MRKCSQACIYLTPWSQECFSKKKKKSFHWSWQQTWIDIGYFMSLAWKAYNGNHIRKQMQHKNSFSQKHLNYENCLVCVTQNTWGLLAIHRKISAFPMACEYKAYCTAKLELAVSSTFFYFERLRLHLLPPPLEYTITFLNKIHLPFMLSWNTWLS